MSYLRLRRWLDSGRRNCHAKDFPVDEASLARAEFIVAMTKAGFALHPVKMSDISTIIETIGFLVDTINLIDSFCSSLKF